MKFTPQSARRSSGLVFLGVAALMLALGQTLLYGRLTGFGFIVYWVICFLFTSLAALSGVLEILLIRFQSRQQQKELIKETLDSVKRDQEQTERERKKDEHPPQ